MGVGSGRDDAAILNTDLRVLKSKKVFVFCSGMVLNPHG